MDLDTLRPWITERDFFSRPETVEVHTGRRIALRGFGHVAGAPNATHE